MVLLFCVLLAACVTAGKRDAYSIDDLFVASVGGRYGLRFFPGSRPDLLAALGWSDPAARPPVAGGRLDLLALSSGGPDGAFGAGAYKGLVAANQWPAYEIVTGISTGAMLAPFVFTGPGNEAVLEALYTGNTFSKLLGPPNFAAALSGPALYSDRKFPAFIERTITPELVARVAAEHARGRRLLVATANLDANQLTVWNMGEIASLGEPGLALFRNVIRAATAVPGALPPVAFATEFGGRKLSELHGDAGILAYFYADPELLPAPLRAPRPGLGSEPAGIDILIHNQIDTQARPIERKTLKIAGASVSTLIRTSLKLLLNETIRQARQIDIAVRYAYLPPEWRTVSSLEFDPGHQRDTFDFGYKRAISGTLWEEGERE